MNVSAPRAIWEAAGRPAHKYEEGPHNGVCATCAADVEVGIEAERINNPTFANHAEFFKFGTHVCRACAWMYGDPKRTHRNVLCVGGELWWPMISVDSATEERPSWMDLFSQLLDHSPETPLCGVLTTDPKPRMWPRMRPATVGSPGLYVHAPDYDVSSFVRFSFGGVRYASRVVRECLLRGYSKSRIYFGLLSDYARAKRDMSTTMKLERDLQSIRGSPEFVPALVTTGVTKEEKAEWKEHHDRGKDRSKNTGPAGGTDRGGASRGAAREDDYRLF